MTKASLDATDEKFEDALKEVAESIDQYIGVVTDTSKNQYEDFNKNLKNEFGKNLGQIQELMNQLRTELDESNKEIVDLKKELNKVDVENQQRLDEVKDQGEIRRLVNEMVSWVAEEKQIGQFNQVGAMDQ